MSDDAKIPNYMNDYDGKLKTKTIIQNKNDSRMYNIKTV